MTAALPVLAGMLAGAAILLPPGPSPRRTLARRLRRADAAGPARSRRGSVVSVIAIALVVAAGVVGPPGGGPPAGLLLLVPAAALAWGRRESARRATRSAERCRREVAEAAHVLSSELRSGRTPHAALAEAALAAPVLGPAASGAALGGDVASALRTAARHPGAEALLLLAAGWWLTERTGAPLAVVAARTTEAIRTEEDLRREVHGQLAAVRSTARLLALLPLVTLGLGSLLGGSALQVLLGTSWGAACAIAGLLLAVAGLVWVDRIATAATRSPWTP